MTTRRDDARARLRFHLELQDGFWFALVVADDRRARESLRAEAAGWCEALGVPFHLHEASSDDLADLAVSLLETPEAGLHWVVTDAGDVTAGAAEEAAGRLLMALNERREALRRHLPGGLVIEGRERLKVLLRNLAPDLFSIRACVLEPAGPSPEVHAEMPWWLGEGLADRSEVRRWGQPGMPWSRWAIAPDGAEEEARTALDEARRMEDRAGPGARSSELNALSRAVEALLAQGWVTEAAPVAERALSLAHRLVAGEEETPPGDGSKRTVASRPKAPTVTAPDAWARSMLAEAHEANAVVAHAQGDLPTARDHWQEALALRESLLGEAPLDATTATRVAEVAHARSHLGELARLAGDESEAERELGAALGLRKRLAEQFPRHSEWRADLALSWSLLGDLRLDRGDLAGALQALDEALRLRRALAVVVPADRRLQALVAVSLGRRSGVLAAMEDREGARADAEESLALLDAVCEAEPSQVNWQAWRSTALSRLGDAALAQGDLTVARDAWETALDQRRDLCDEDPENARWQQALAVVLDRLAELDLLEGERGEAWDHASEALEIAEHLGWQDPSNATWQLALARARLVSSEVAAARGDGGEAARLAGLAVDAHAHARALGVRGWRVEALGDRLKDVLPRLRPELPS